MKTYLIATSSVERNGDLMFVNLGDFSIALSVGHAFVLGQELSEKSGFPAKLAERFGNRGEST